MSNAKLQRLWQRSEVAKRILAGDNLVIYRDTVIRVPPSWLKAHPGGALAILHYVGRDASDEIDVYHGESALKLVKKYTVGRIETSEKEGWKPLVPPFALGWIWKSDEANPNSDPKWTRTADIETNLTERGNGNIHFTEHNTARSEILLVEKNTSKSASPDVSGPTLSSLEPPATLLSVDVQNRHAQAFKTLHQRVTDAGLYKTPYITGYGPEVVRYVALALASFVAYRHQWFLTSALSLGLLWHQLTFIVHDLGHMGVTHDWTSDRFMGVSIAAFMGGLSVGWWVDVSEILLSTSLSKRFLNISPVTYLES